MNLKYVSIIRIKISTVILENKSLIIDKTINFSVSIKYMNMLFIKYFKYPYSYWIILILQESS